MPSNAVITAADFDIDANEGTVRLLVGGVVLEDGRVVSDYPALLASDCPTIHMLTVRAPVASPTLVPSTPSAYVAAEAARTGRQARLTGPDGAEDPAAQRQRLRAEQCEADRLLAIAIAQADEDEHAQAAAALEDQYELATEGSTRFSDDDDADSDGSAADDTALEPEQVDEIAELAAEISTARAQTAWSGKAPTPQSNTASCTPSCSLWSYHPLPLL